MVLLRKANSRRFSKNNMKKLLKRAIMTVFVIIAFSIFFVVVSFIRHRVQLAKEEAIYQPIGELVSVNGHDMNVYTEGNGSITLVFMSGGGTCSPVLDFRTLYSRLSDTYKIAVVEKAGYGFSEETTDVPRDVDTMLEETRQALDKAGVKGPYVLCPHSMSGIEALYWAQQYPDEVSGIIGLDMAVPQAYETMELNIPLLKLGAWAIRVGLPRWLPSLAESDAIKYGTLTEDEKTLYRAVFYRCTGTADMLREAEQIQASAAMADAQPMPDIPALLFCSNGSGTGFDEDTWREFQKTFAQNRSGYILENLDCSHYVHDIAYEEIEEKMRGFLERTNKTGRG